jgi:AcrR family transcriptional regulator
MLPALDDNTRRRLLEAAGPIFARKGLEAASVGEITEEAKANRAAVNYHFRSKEQLYVETVRYAAEACVRHSPVPRWPEGVPAEERLKGFIRAFLGRFLGEAAPDWHAQLIMREVSQPTAGACEQFVREFVRPTFNALQAILRDLTPPDLPPARLHLLGSSIVGQCLHYHHARHVLPLLVGPAEHRGYDLERLTEHVYAFSLAALRGLFPRHARAAAGAGEGRA